MNGLIRKQTVEVCSYSVLMLQVQVNNEESDETYDSSWSYMQHIQSNAMFIHDRRTFHKELSETKVSRYTLL